MEAFKIYAGESGLDCSSYIICAPDKYEYGGYSATRTLFDAPTKPTAIICANDYMAIGAMKALSDLDIKVPEEVSVLGFDDSTLLNYLVKSLTTIKQHKHRLGEEAGRLLLQRMHEHTLSDLQSPLVNIVIKPELIVRDSTGPCCEARRNIQMLS